MTIPNFTNPEHKARFDELFNDYVASYSNLFQVVGKGLFGVNFSVDTTSPQSLEIIRELTSTFIYEVENRFEKEYPEYKEDNDIFVNGGRIKAEVQEAFETYLTSKNE